MAKITLPELTSGFYSTTALNTAFADIETEFENTLSRDGTVPNQMAANLDMNSQRILNLPEPLTNSEPARLADVQNSLAGGAANLITFSPYGTISATNIQAALQEEVDDLAASSGSSLVGFLQSGTGAVARTAQDKIREVVSVDDFGAVGDGVTDDTAAVQAAFTYIAANGVALHVPAKSYLLTARITASGPVEINGESMRGSRFIWSDGAADRGISVTLGSTGGLRHTFKANNLSILTDGAALGSGLHIKDTTPADRFNPSVRVENVVISGATNPNSDGWFIGIYMDGCQGAFIDGCDIWGKVGALGEPNYDSDYGIYYANVSLTSPHPTEFQVTNCAIKAVETAIYADDMEGLVVSDNQIVGVGTGIEARGLATYPHVSITNNHINAASKCILVVKMYEAIILGNLLYNQNQSTVSSCIDIQGDAMYFNISNNTFENMATSVEANSIVVTAGSYGLINSNVFRRSDSVDGTANGTAVWLTAGSSYTKVGDANVYDAVGVNTKVLDQGTLNDTSLFLAAGSGYEISSHGIITQWGSSVVTLDASGNGTVTFPLAFKSAFYSATVCNGDPTFHGEKGFCVIHASCTTTTLAFAVRVSPGAVAVRVNWSAVGH